MEFICMIRNRYLSSFFVSRGVVLEKLGSVYED